MRVPLYVLLVVVTVGGPACDSPSSPSPAVGEASTPANADVVARGIAMALADEDMRALVLDAMRQSPFTEHKLGFQEFAASPEGTTLLYRAAQALGVEHGQFTSLVEELPPLDFYLPNPTERQSWRATPDLLVAAMLTKSPSALVGYRPSGEISLIDPGIGSRDDHLILLQFAEFKSRRIAPQLDTPGNVIQDPDDGAIGGVYRLIVGQDTASVELADLASGSVRLADIPLMDQVAQPPCEETEEDLVSCQSGGGGSSAPPGGWAAGSTGTIIVETIETFFMNDNGVKGESNEFYFEGIWVNQAVVVEASVHIMGVPANGTIQPNQAFMPKIPNYLPVHVTLKETDGVILEFGSDQMFPDINLWPADNFQDQYYKEQPNISVFDDFKARVVYGW